MPEADPAPCVRYVNRVANPVRLINRIRQDLIGVEAQLEVLKIRVRQLEDVRADLLADLCSLDD